jgi:hypothetical protein
MLTNKISAYFIIRNIDRYIYIYIVKIICTKYIYYADKIKNY